MHIFGRPYDQWSEHIQHQMLAASFEDGSMRYCVAKKPSTWTYAIFDEGDVLKAWMVIWPTCHLGTFATVFVTDTYRKQGLAEALFDRALNDNDELHVLRWEQKANSLFDKVAARHPGKLIMHDWLPFKAKHGQLQDID